MTRRSLRRLGWPIVTVVLCLPIVLGLAGQVLRDRNGGLALCMYLPLLPLGIVAVLVDLLRKGRSIPRLRFALAGLGVTAILVPLGTLAGRGADSPPGGSGNEADVLRVVHWNVQWGGRPAEAPSWRSIRAEIRKRAPDVLILSEAPPASMQTLLLQQLGPEWHQARFEQLGRDVRYHYHLLIASRWPVTPERRVHLPHGAALLARIDRPDRPPLRVLLADIQSNPRTVRTSTLHGIARICAEAQEQGRPIDLVAGDMNSLARSIGFDALQTAGDGYALASWNADGWRGTFPSWCPIYDIDHIWVSRRLAVRSCELFGNAFTNHRGQVAEVTPR